MQMAHIATTMVNQSGTNHDVSHHQSLFDTETKLFISCSLLQPAAMMKLVTSPSVIAEDLGRIKGVLHQQRDMRGWFREMNYATLHKNMCQFHASRI